MVLKIIYFGLLIVAKVGEREGVASGEVPIDSGQLAEGWGRDESSGNDVMIVVAPRENFVIALSVVRAEHESYEWQLQLVSDG